MALFVTEPDKKTAPRADRLLTVDGLNEIFMASPISHCNTDGARAYAAQATRGGSSNLIAYVLDDKNLPRYDLLGKAQNVNSHYVLRFASVGVVQLPDYKRQCPVVFYEKPAGPPIMASLSAEHEPNNNEVGFRHVITSIFDGLRDCYLAGVSHGRINPTNLFIRDAAGNSLQLGDYISSAPGKYQHYAFETIERMMASPAAKGPPTSSDDIYAAGATLLMLLLGKMPSILMSQDELLQAKIEKGSMMALLGGMRLPSSYSELMRGLLSDDPKLRWNLDDVTHWLNGRRLGSKTPGLIRKAQRAFEFNGKAYTNQRLLAHEMGRDAESASKLIEDGSIDRWLRRSLGDETKAEFLAEAVASASSTQRGGTLPERVVARASIALDPSGPITFRGISARPDGVGALLAEYYLAGKSPKDIADLLSSQFISFWVNQQFDLGGDSSTILQMYEGARMLLERAQVGFGIERVLYELMPGMPCMSPLMNGVFAQDIPDMLRAIEASAADITAAADKRDPIDRHIAAFILTHYKRVNDRLFNLLGSSVKDGSRAVGIVSIYAELQKKYHPDKMPNLGTWLAALLDASVDRFYNRPLREKIRKDIVRAGRKGDLEMLLELVDNSAMVQKDEDGFTAACRDWQRYEHQARELNNITTSGQEKLVAQAQLITAFIAVFVALTIIAIMIFVKIM